ncbi:MAG: M1 family aminopeptidase [Promethearchaeota archaeon]
MSVQNFKILRKGITLCIIVLCVIPIVSVSNTPSKIDNTFDELPIIPKNDLKSSQINYPYNGSELSNITLELVLHDTDHIVEGVMKIDYFNNDSLIFDALAFHTFVDGMYYYIRPGSMEIFHVYENGNPGTPLIFETHPNDQYMWVNLSTSLAPKSRVQFDIHFNTTFPDGGIDRCNEYEIPGDIESRIFKYAWGYPIPVVFDEFDGWNLDPYKIDGEPFYADMAWYNVTVEVLDDFVVAATGENYQTDDLGAWTKYYYDPKLPVREFTFSASKYFIVQTWSYNGATKTYMSAYYIPRSISIWEDFMVNQTLEAFLRYTWIIGDYPYPTLNVVAEHTHYGGMEHACQVYITVNAQQHFAEIVMAHELAHQWFFHIIGNDQADVGFIDEGFACWLDAYYQEKVNPSWESDYAPSFESARAYEFNTGNEHRINCSAYEFSSYNTSYWYVAYTKSPVIYQKLRLILGENTFIEGLKLMYARYRFGFIWLDGVQKAFEDACGQDLDWFFYPWFNNGKLPEYDLTKASFDPTTNKLTIDVEDIREGTHLYSYTQLVPIEILDKDMKIIENCSIWVNGTQTPDIVFDIPDGVEPYKAILFNRGAALAYKLGWDDDDIIEEFLITIDPSTNIPGFSVILVLFSALSTVYALTVVIKKKINKK